MRETVRILKTLISKGSINDREDSELFTAASYETVSEELDIFAEEWRFKIIRTIHDIYIVPLQDCEMLNVKLREIRENAGSYSRNADAYLQCYIIMTILWLLFGSKNGGPQSAEFLTIKDITEAVEKRLYDDNEAIFIEEKQIDFKTICGIWNNKAIRSEGRKSSKTQLVLTACKFLERNMLIEFRDDHNEIRPLRRLIDIMTKYYLNEARIEEINALFEKGENQYADNE